jgi:ketosteroid isomerase-like protein
VALYHDDYKGWDYDSPLPAGKASSEKWLTYASENYNWIIHELTPAAIVIVDDVAVVHYYYTAVFADLDGEKENTDGRWTDILMKDGDAWKLIADHGGREKDD